MVPNTEKGRSFQQELYAKLFHHWQNDLTNKVGFDVQKSGFAIENLPTCSSSPDYTLRCVFIMKNIRTDKVNMLSILMNNFQLESFFYTHNVKMCSDIKWMHPNEKKKIYNTYRFGEDGFDCITSSSADRFRLMEYVFSSRRSVQSRWRLRHCNFDILVSNDGDGEGTDNLEESQSSETDDNKTDDDIDGDRSAKLSENKMDDNDVNDVKGSDDKAALISAATVNMDLEMTDDDDDEEEEEEETATIDEASNGADSGIANDESTISDSNVCDGEGGGGGDGCGSASAIAASATAASAASAAADSPENFSSHPSSKHEKSKSSSSVVPSSFKAPICIGSIPLKN